MKHCLHIYALNTSSVLERVLRVIRYRGFKIISLKVHPDERSAGYHITLSVLGERPLPNLQKQLSKLIDVDEVMVITSHYLTKILK